MRKLLPAVLVALVACTTSTATTSTSIAPTTTVNDVCVEARVIYEEAAYAIGDLANTELFAASSTFRLAVFRFANVAELFPECFSPEELVRAATAKDNLEFLDP